MDQHARRAQDSEEEQEDFQEEPPTMQIDFDKLKWHHGRPEFDDSCDAQLLQTEAGITNTITNDCQQEVECTPQMKEKLTSRCQVSSFTNILDIRYTDDT